MRQVHVLGTNQPFPRRRHPQPHRRETHRGATHRAVPRAAEPRASGRCGRGHCRQGSVARRDDPHVRLVRDRALRGDARRGPSHRHRRCDRCHLRVRYFPLSTLLFLLFQSTPAIPLSYSRPCPPYPRIQTNQLCSIPQKKKTVMFQSTWSTS